MSPIGGPITVQEWQDSATSPGVTPTLDGGLENTPDNRVPDPAMRDLAPGGTRAMRLLSGPRLDGHHFYSSPADGPQSALVKQTGLPQPPAENSRLEEQPIIEIGQRPGQPFDPALPRLIVRKVQLAASKQGFAGVWRLAAVGARTEGGAYTTTTTPVAFQHGNGQRLEWRPPVEWAEGTHEWVLFVSEEAATEAALKASTMREVDAVRAGKRVGVAKGPFSREAKKRPLTNETMLGRDNRPRWGEELKVAGHVGRGRERRPATGDMEKMENASVAFVFHTPRGASLAGQRSRNRDLDEKKNRALWARPKSPPEDATGFTPYLFLGGTSYRVVRPGLVYKTRPFPIDEWVPIYGNAGSEDGDSSAGGASGRGYATSLVAEEPPEEDASGVEPPTGEMDPPVGVGFARPPAGAYWKTYAPVRGGIAQRAAVPVKETIASSEVLMLEVPNPVNRLPNPAATLRGADGSALSWAEVLTNGVSSDGVGKPGVATSGLVNDATAYPTGSPSGAPHKQTDWVPVNQGATETVRGVLEVSAYAGSGFGRHFLVQRLDTGAVLVTTLAERNSNGATPYEATVGPTGSGASLVLDEGATDLALRIGTSPTAGRNMTVRGYDLALHPFDGAPRKFVFPPEGTGGIANPDAPPEAPYPPGPVVCVTRPKSAAPPPSFVPVQVLSAPDAAGETAARNPATAATGLSAGPPYRAFSNATGQRAHAYYAKTYPLGTGAGNVNGSSLAARAPFGFPLLPTRTGNNLVFLAVLDASDRFMGYARVTNGGAVQLVARNAAGRDTVAPVSITGLSATDVADCEVIVGGGDTARGRVSLVGSVGDEPRREIASIEGVNFAGRVPRQRRFLGVYEKDTAGKWEVTAPWLRVTSSGDVVEEFGDVPSVPPDRPVGADGAYRELQTEEVAGEEPEDLPVHQGYLHIPVGFEGEERGFVWDDFYVPPGLPSTVALYARYEDFAAQPADTARVTVFDADGNAWEAPSPLPAATSGTAGWQEYVSAFTPPAGFFRARLSVVRTGSGMLIFQEPLVSDGVL